MQQIVMIMAATFTCLFMLFCMSTDLRERVVYVFPCYVLIPVWMLIGASVTEKAVMFGIILVLHIAAYLFFKIAGIWGDGDSDIFLLFGMIFAVFMLTVKPEDGIGLYIVAELLGMIAALVLSFVIGLIEAGIKKKKLSKTSSIAVVPGFSIVIIGMIAWMIFGR